MKVSGSRFVVLALFLQLSFAEPERRFACWGSHGPPVVSAQCPRDTVIQVVRAGLKVQHGGGKCIYKASDCGCEFGDAGCDMPNVRDLCMGRPACRLDVTQQYINSETCRGFSDYMFIEFNCVALEKKSVMNICDNDFKVSNQGFLRSPNYPNHYPDNRHCECSFSTAPGSNIALTVLDLHVPDRSCTQDTLTLEFANQKTTLCGHHKQTRNLVTTSNKVDVIFDTDESITAGGFWIKYEAEPPSSIQLQCRSLYKPPPQRKNLLDHKAQNPSSRTSKPSVPEPMNRQGTENRRGNHLDGDRGALRSNERMDMRGNNMPRDREAYRRVDEPNRMVHGKNKLERDRDLSMSNQPNAPKIGINSLPGDKDGTGQDNRPEMKTHMLPRDRDDNADFDSLDEYEKVIQPKEDPRSRVWNSEVTTTHRERNDPGGNQLANPQANDKVSRPKDIDHLPSPSNNYDFKNHGRDPRTSNRQDQIRNKSPNIDPEDMKDDPPISFFSRRRIQQKQQRPTSQPQESHQDVGEKASSYKVPRNIQNLNDYREGAHSSQQEPLEESQQSQRPPQYDVKEKMSRVPSVIGSSTNDERQSISHSAHIPPEADSLLRDIHHAERSQNDMSKDVRYRQSPIHSQRDPKPVTPLNRPEIRPSPSPTRSQNPSRAQNNGGYSMSNFHAKSESNNSPSSQADKAKFLKSKNDVKRNDVNHGEKDVIQTVEVMKDNTVMDLTSSTNIEDKSGPDTDPWWWDLTLVPTTNPPKADKNHVASDKRVNTDAPVQFGEWVDLQATTPTPKTKPKFKFRKEESAKESQWIKENTIQTMHATSQFGDKRDITKAPVTRFDTLSPGPGNLQPPAPAILPQGILPGVEPFPHRVPPHPLPAIVDVPHSAPAILNGEGKYKYHNANRAPFIKRGRKKKRRKFNKPRVGYKYRESRKRKFLKRKIQPFQRQPQAINIETISTIKEVGGYPMNTANNRQGTDKGSDKKPNQFSKHEINQVKSTSRYPSNLDTSESVPTLFGSNQMSEQLSFQTNKDLSQTSKPNRRFEQTFPKVDHSIRNIEDNGRVNSVSKVIMDNIPPQIQPKQDNRQFSSSMRVNADRDNSPGNGGSPHKLPLSKQTLKPKEFMDYDEVFDSIQKYSDVAEINSGNIKERRKTYPDDKFEESKGKRLLSKHEMKAIQDYAPNILYDGENSVYIETKQKQNHKHPISSDSPQDVFSSEEVGKLTINNGLRSHFDSKPMLQHESKYTETKLELPHRIGRNRGKFESDLHSPHKNGDTINERAKANIFHENIHYGTNKRVMHSPHKNGDTINDISKANIFHENLHYGTNKRFVQSHPSNDDKILQTIEEVIDDKISKLRKKLLKEANHNNRISSNYDKHASVKKDIVQSDLRRHKIDHPKTDKSIKQEDLNYDNKLSQPQFKVSRRGTNQQPMFPRKKQNEITINVNGRSGNPQDILSQVMSDTRLMMGGHLGSNERVKDSGSPNNLERRNTQRNMNNDDSFDIGVSFEDLLNSHVPTTDSNNIQYDIYEKDEGFGVLSNNQFLYSPNVKSSNPKPVSVVEPNIVKPETTLQPRTEPELSVAKTDPPEIEYVTKFDKRQDTTKTRKGKEDLRKRVEKGLKRAKSKNASQAAKNESVSPSDAEALKGEPMTVTIIAAAVIGGIVLIIAIGIGVRFIMNRVDPSHARRQMHKKECVMRRNQQLTRQLSRQMSRGKTFA